MLNMSIYTVIAHLTTYHQNVGRRRTKGSHVMYRVGARIILLEISAGWKAPDPGCAPADEMTNFLKVQGALVKILAPQLYSGSRKILRPPLPEIMTRARPLGYYAVSQFYQLCTHALRERATAGFDHYLMQLLQPQLNNLATGGIHATSLLFTSALSEGIVFWH